MKEGKGKYNCTAGKTMLVMDELGNVNPCEILPSKFGYGNIRNFNYNVNLMWEEQKIKKFKKELKKKSVFVLGSVRNLIPLLFHQKESLRCFSMH